MNDAAPSIIRFGPYELDVRSGELRKGVTRVRLPDQPFQILLMLCTHLFEVLLWAITLVLTDAVQDFRDAFYYSSVTYTTLGYEDIVLPHNWRLLAPMIAMSGVFAFGWTTGVIVNLVAQSNATMRKDAR